MQPKNKISASLRVTDFFSSHWLKNATAVVALLSAFLNTGCAEPEPVTSEPLMLSGQTMGTSWSVLVAEKSTDLSEIELALQQELQRINQLMSTWDPNSELSRFNKLSSVEPVVLHADTLRVIDTARRISQLTDGRYDITLHPVIKLWGFGNEVRTDSPSNAQVADMLQLTGRQKLVRVGHTVRKRRPEVSVDVSSLAKGFAVDQLGRVLESFQIDNYLVEIGGEIRARGYRAEGTPWLVGIEQPDGRALQGLRLVNSHVASSGSYRNYREEGGKRVSHIIDGSTGKPIEHALVAVSVVHESAMLADAWATALLVVGESRARALIEQQGLAAQLTFREADAFKIFRSASFSALLSTSP